MPVAEDGIVESSILLPSVTVVIVEPVDKWAARRLSTCPSAVARFFNCFAGCS
jgi:hypothetical protein